MSSIEQQNNKRIAKNTMLLYFRMLLTMVVGLYTSRVILRNLGVENFGIYNAVGGVVSMFAVVSGSLTTAVSRFLTFELGKGDLKKLKEVFCSSVTIQLLLSAVVVVLAESVGVWFLNHKMTIPADRMFAANWVFQLSLLTFCIGLISVPYNAAIVAHERMAAFAYVGLIDVFGKLAIAIGIASSPVDKLIFYAILMCFMSLLMRFIYGWFCKRNFEECSFHFVFRKNMLKKMFSFAGWNFIGASSAVLRDHGGNVIINMFCGPAVNAARGIAMQVNNSVSQFVNNFMTALNPQITKSYANGNNRYMMSLVFQGARLSFYMLMFLSFPIIFNTEYILSIWLKNVPEHTTFFVQLVLVFVMSESISSPLITAMLATGKIRDYQIVVGGLQMLNLPVSYLVLRNGCPPESVLIVAIVISQICLIARLIMLRKMIDLDVAGYVKHVYLNVWVVAIVACILPIMLKMNCWFDTPFVKFIALCCISTASSILSILFVGCNREDRMLIYSKINAMKQKVLKK